jgi:phosphoglycerate dehydrogenase-like enzyme
MANVILTPHIAGSNGPECRRLGRLMVDELQRFLSGEPLKYGIDRQHSATMA